MYFPIISHSLKILCHSHDLISRSLDLISHSLKISCHSLDLISRSLDLISHSFKILCRSLDLISGSLKLITGMSREQDIKLREQLIKFARPFLGSTDVFVDHELKYILHIHYSM